MTQNIITKAVYTADGATKSYTIPFEYLSRSHVYISVDGNSVPYSYTHAYGITFDTAPVKNSIIIIERQTPYDEPFITWTDGTVLIADDLNAQLLQVLFVLQENQEALEGALAYDPLLDAYDVLNHRITNLADPIDPQDAVTKQFFENYFTNFRASINAAVARANQHAMQAAACKEQACACAQQAVNTLTAVNTTGAEWLRTLNDFLPEEIASRFFVDVGILDGGTSMTYADILSTVDGDTSANFNVTGGAYDGQTARTSGWIIINPELKAIADALATTITN